MTFTLKQLMMLVGVVGIICADILHWVKPGSSINDLSITISSISLAIIGYSVAMNLDGSVDLNVKTVLAFVAVAGIAVAKFLFNKLKTDRRYTLMLFVFGILMLGVVIGLGNSNLSYVLGVLGAFLVVLGVVVLNPIVKSGQGNYLISVGWMLMIAANSS